MKMATWYALIALIVAVALLPILKAMAPQIFPEGFRGNHVAHTRSAGEGFHGSRAGREYFNGGAPAAAPAHAPPPAPSCENAPCPEGQFCSDQKRCEPRYIGGAVPDGCE